MKTFKLLLPLSLLALSACGKLESEKIHPAGSGPVTTTWSLTANQFTSSCQMKQGTISSDGTMCLGLIHVNVADQDQPGDSKVPVDSSFANGKFIVSTGNNSQLEITLNGNKLANAATRGLFVSGNGALALHILDPNHHTGSISVYTCYDRNMHGVYCNDSVIPK